MTPAPESSGPTVVAGRSGRTASPAARGGPLDVEMPWAIPATEVAESLGVDVASGLSDRMAAERLRDVGANVLEEVKRTPLLRLVIGAVSEPFVVLLAIAGILAIALGEVRDGLLVLLGLVPIVGADVVTEYRGDRALAALREASAPMARVRRGGRGAELPAADLVPGDVVLVRAGDVVPADLRVTSVAGLQVDRSVLTGESLPETAALEPDRPDATLADRRAMLFASTSVVSGRGEGIVVATGPWTEVGRIAGGLDRAERRRSPLQRELDRLVRILLVVAVGLIITTTGLGFARGYPAGENVLAGISAAIAAIPEEPPILLAVILGLGAYRLLRRGVLVRRLNAEETLGAVDLILTDKTGTLTQNRLAVDSLRNLDGSVDDRDLELTLLVAGLRAEDDAWGLAEGVRPSSFTRALAAAIEELGGSPTTDPAVLEEAVAAGNGAPFARTRYRVDGRRMEAILGAPEAVLAECANLSHDERLHWEGLVEGAAAGAERLLLLAERRPDAGEPEPGDWRPRGLIGFADPIRDGMGTALATAAGAGIQTVVVTGDHPLTAAAIALAAGLEVRRTVTGTELDSWDADRLAAELPTLSVVARATPEQKLRLVRAARGAGRTVAVTGDGVNDAPALANADVAVAMGSGTAVAREASDLVLGDDSFGTLMFGLREGRRIVANVKTGLVFLLSTHVAFLGFIFLATLWGLGQPLLPIQILWMELFIDLSTSVAFEREPEEPGAMARPPRPRGRPLLDRTLLIRISGAGMYTALAALVLIATNDAGFDHARWLAYTALVVSQAVRAYSNRSLRVPLHELPRNGFLLLACVLTVLVQAAIPHVPALAATFRATPLDGTDWFLVALVALPPAIVAWAYRAVTRREWVA